MEFFVLPLIAEIGAAFAGFATLAGIIRHDELVADAIFSVVLQSLIAVFFALAAILFVGSGGSSSESLRAIAMGLLLASVLAVAREIQVYLATWRQMKEEEKEGGFGRALGLAGLVSMLPSPLLAASVAGGIFPARAAFLYELALLSHLLVAILLLLYVVWKNFALRPD